MVWNFHFLVRLPRSFAIDANCLPFARGPDRGHVLMFNSLSGTPTSPVSSAND